MTLEEEAEEYENQFQWPDGTESMDFIAGANSKWVQAEILKVKIQCWTEALQFIDDNYMSELINIRIYNMQKQLENETNTN